MLPAGQKRSVVSFHPGVIKDAERLGRIHKVPGIQGPLQEELEVGTCGDTVSTMSFSACSKSVQYASTALNLSSPGLAGRDEEVRTLMNCYNRLEHSRELVCIGGPSGSGKSSLATHLEAHVAKREVSFLSGKYTLTQQDEPYAAFVQICRQITSTSMGLDLMPLDYFKCIYGQERIVEQLKQELGTQARVLCRVVPCLKPILLGDETGSHDLDQQTETGLRLDERHQLQIAFRIFFRVLCAVKPHVLLVDDLQWADQASVDLLRYLITDRENRSFMIIGCFRNDQVYDLMPFGKSMGDFENSAKEDGYGFTRITVGNLDVSAINHIVQSVVMQKCDDDTTLSLSEVVHSRTLGNPFFSLQFIKSLVKDGLLAYDENKGSFTWDLDRIKRETVATTDAVEFMQAKLEKLPLRVKSMVQLASSLGTAVHTYLFRLILDDFDRGRDFYTKVLKISSPLAGDVDQNLSADEILNLFMVEGIMYQINPDEFKWEHDKILEAAMIPNKGNKTKVYLRVGELLLEKLNEDELDKHLFVVVGLLNEGSSRIPTTQTSKRVLIAELNLKAGKKSLNNSGFETSRGYFTKGISLLPSNHGRVYSDLSVDLFSSAAEAEYCVGDFDGMAKHCRDVISRPGVPLVEKKRAYKSLMLGLNGKGNSAEAYALCLEILQQLGFRIPKRLQLLRILAGLNDMKNIGNKGLDDVLNGTPTNEDPDKLWAFDILSDMFVITYVGDMPLQMALTTFKSFQWTLKHGRSPRTPLFLAEVGAVAICMNEYQIGADYGDQALAEIELETDERLVCDVIFLTFTFVWHWSHLIDAERLVRAYTAGIKVGSVENASWCINNNLEHRYFTGAPLVALLQDSIKYAHQMKEFDVVLPYNCTLFIIQSVENLMKTSTNPSRLSGSTMNEDQKEKEYSESANTLCTSMMRQYQFILAFLFDDFDRFHELRQLQNEKDIEDATPGLFGLCVISFGNAMCAISLYRQTRKRSYLRTAKKLIGRLKGWANAGVSFLVFIHHTYSFKLNIFLTHIQRLRTPTSHTSMPCCMQKCPKSQANRLTRRARSMPRQ